MTNTRKIAQYPYDVSSLSGFRNKIINGNHSINQRGTSLAPGTGIRFGSDRWRTYSVGSTIAYNCFAIVDGVFSSLGFDYLPYYTIVSSTGENNGAFIDQTIENVRTLSGKQVTLTFHAMQWSGTGITKIGWQVFQVYGGTTYVFADSGVVNIDSNLRKFSQVLYLPPINGSVTANNSLTVRFYFDTGNNFQPNLPGMPNVGRQSGKVCINHISLVEGDATLEDDPFSPRHIQQEIALCQRYYEVGRDRNYEHGDGNTVLQLSGSYKVSKRNTPTVSYSLSGTGVAYAGATTVTFEESSIEGFIGYVSPTNPSGGYGFATMTWRADAEL